MKRLVLFLSAAALVLVGTLGLEFTSAQATIPKLNMPTGLTASGAVTLNWDSVPNATGYIVSESDVLPNGTPVSGTTFSMAVGSGYYTWKVYATAPGFRTSTPAVLTINITNGNPQPSPSPMPSPSPSPLPSPTPSPSPIPTPSPSPIPSPTPNGSCVPGTFPTSYFEPPFVGAPSRVFVDQFIVDNGDGTITTCYPAGSSAPSSGAPGGAQAELQLPNPNLDTVTLTYQIRFPIGFQWIKGGKLPGLCGGSCPTGSNNGPGGFTTRYMWRDNGIAEVLLSDATTTGTGTDLGRGTWTNFLADGQFHTLSQTITLNTPGIANGTLDATYNGVTMHINGLTFLGSADTNLHVNGFMFCTFYGGHDSSWAPTQVEHIDFSNFTVG